MSLFPPPALYEGDNEQSWSEPPKYSTIQARMDDYATAIQERIIDPKKICKLARRGVPEKYRADYWKIMIGILPPLRETWESVRAKKCAEYQEIVRSVLTLDADGNVELGQDQHRIDVDIPRTMPSLHFFAHDEQVLVEGTPVAFSLPQHSLRRILHTCSRVNRGFGYVQGMNELVGHFLFTYADGKASQLTPEVESDAFFSFQALLTFLGDNFCRSLDFDKDTGVMSMLRTFDGLFAFCDPELHDHVETTLMVRSEFYAFRWMTLMLTQEFLTPDVLRLWDYLFSFGSNMSTALLYSAIAMLIFARDDLLAMESLGQALPFLQQYPPVDMDALLRVAQELFDEYGMERVRIVRGEVISPTSSSPTSPSGKASKGGEPGSGDRSAAKVKEEVTQKLNGWMSSIKGWGKSLSTHLNSASSNSAGDSAKSDRAESTDTSDQPSS